MVSFKIYITTSNHDKMKLKSCRGSYQDDCTPYTRTRGGKGIEVILLTATQSFIRKRTASSPSSSPLPIQPKV